MNTNNRWPLAIFFSILVHIIIFITTALFGPITAPIKKLPADIFIAEQQSVAVAVNSASEPKLNSTDDTSTSIISKSKVVNKVPSEQKHAKDLPTPPKQKTLLPIPPQYSISSLSGQDLTKALSLNSVPPKPITTPKNIQLPDNLPPDTTRLDTTILFIVTADGHVKAKVEKTSGNTDFDNAVLRTIYTWRFEKMSTDFPIPLEQVFTWPISH